MGRIDELESMMEQNPDDPFVIYALAREYEQHLSTMQALMMYEHLITEHPRYIATYYHYSKLLYQAGNRKEAKRLLQKGIEQGTIEKDMHSVSEMQSLLSTWDDHADDAL